MRPPPRSILCLALSLALLTLLATPGRAVAKQDAAPDPNAQPAGTPGSPTTAAVPASGTALSVDLQPLHIGTGYGRAGAIRPGGWIGVQVEVKDRSGTLRSLLLRLGVRDADGDTCRHQVVLPPNPTQKVWLYAWLPFLAGKDNSVPLRIEAYTVREGSEVAGATGAVAEQLVGVFDSATFPPIARIPEATAQAAVIGGNARGDTNLGQYAERTNGTNSRGNFSPMGHQVLFDQIPTLTTADLPDRWMGLYPFDFIVWRDAGPGTDPNELTESQADALRGWLYHGGHLVVVLPTAGGDTWVRRGDRAHKLIDTIPAVTVERRESIDLSGYKRLLRRPDADPMPRSGLVQNLIPDPAAKPGDAITILAGPDGKPVVTRRLVGAGAVTLIGLDIFSGELRRSGGFEPDIFWHRVLGRTGQLEPAAEIVKMSTPNRNGQITANFTSRHPVTLDDGITNLIAQSESAGVGVALAFAVFSLYWVAAGVGGFAALKRRNLAQHGWLLFVACAGVFTALAWGGANLLRPQTVRGKHFTIVEHVYGQTNERARTWVAMVLPWYGRATVTVGNPGSESEQRLSAVAAFDAPPNENGETVGGASFPDAQGYAADSRAPNTLSVPTRATVKQFQIDWSGPPSPKWDMPRPISIGRDGTVGPGTISPAPDNDPLADPTKPRAVVQGILVHNLPGALTDVHVVVNRGQDLNVQTFGPSPLLLGRAATAYTIREPWKPGNANALDLSAVTAQRAADKAAPLGAWLQNLLPNRNEGLIGNFSTGQNTDWRRWVGQAFITTLPVPEYTQVNMSLPYGRQQATHGLDLGRWLTQPCVIVMGTLGSDDQVGAPCPVPIAVDDADPERLAPRLRGRTIVRWIYPLPDAPPAIPTP
jgi:hypothetical protein